MPDLNELLAWATANTPAPDASTASESADLSTQLSLRFNPTSQAHPGSSALHPSDPGHPSNVAATSVPTPAKRADLTSEMLDLILGKSDSIVMKEKMAIASDTSKSMDDRVEALDDFEMLIEMLDNANNMAILKLWEPLLALLKDEHQPVIAHACWIVGTAIQNNLKAQAALYVYNALPSILSIIYPENGTSKNFTATRAKATYALSSALKHWPLASAALSANSSQGYSVLKRGVQDSEPVIRRKMAFLIGTLTMQSGETYEGEIPGEVRNLVEESTKSGGEKQSLVEGLGEAGVYSALIDGLRSNTDDVEYEENILRALSKASSKGGLAEAEKREVKDIWTQWGSAGQAERGLEGEDAAEITKSFA